jgi:hypothetical protein
MTLSPSQMSIATRFECHKPLEVLSFILERRPVTPKVAGSSPVAPAISVLVAVTRAADRVLFETSLRFENDRRARPCVWFPAAWIKLIRRHARTLARGTRRSWILILRDRAER